MYSSWERTKKNPLFKKPLNTDLKKSIALPKEQSPIMFKTLQKQAFPKPFTFLHIFQEMILPQASRNKNSSYIKLLAEEK